MAQQGFSQQVIANLVNQDIMMGYVPTNGVPGMIVPRMIPGAHQTVPNPSPSHSQVLNRIRIGLTPQGSHMHRG
jgi:hypothetical protein